MLNGGKLPPLDSMSEVSEMWMLSVDLALAPDHMLQSIYIAAEQSGRPWPQLLSAKHEKT